MTKPTLSIFSGSQHLGLIYREQNQINVKFVEVNIPFTNTQGRLSWNIGGKTRLMILQGAHDGNGFGSAGNTQNEKLATFVAVMESWVNYNGEQQTAVFTNSLEDTFTVDAVDWSWTRSRDDPNRIIYSLIMKER